MNREFCPRRTYLRVQALHDHDELRQGEVYGLLVCPCRQAQVQAFRYGLYMLHFSQEYCSH